MAGNSKIEWTEMTWNPVTGCTKVSPGCAHCYAETMARRLHLMGNPRYRNGFKLTLHDDLVDAPVRWKTPRLVFVNSMSDLFHEDVPIGFIRRVLETMRRCPQHQFQVLTKRAERLAKLADRLDWRDNIWMGVSIENQRYAYRAELLARVPARVRFLSIEPLLGEIDALPLEGIHWVIVGGESGCGARPMRREWVECVLRQCRKARVPFFFKQWGGVQKHATGRELNGRTYDEMPAPRSAAGRTVQPPLLQV
ncbi:MAG TPA: phage Gp37/Gp68 family protein [Phycisphaerae bacterium]|nr:phage Gp37/Gp68 family protein [Phycisphaerae bacterium]